VHTCAGLAIVALASLAVAAGSAAVPMTPHAEAAAAVPPPVPRGASGRGAGVSGFPQLQGPLNVTADEVVVGNKGAGLVARGHVRLTYQDGVATADQLRLRRDDRTAELSGNVAISDPKGKASGNDVLVTFTAANQIGRITMAGNAGVENKDYALQADHITADRAVGRLVADGHVTMFTAPDLIVNGDRAVYNQGARYGVISGHVAASNRLGRILGDWMEFFQQKQQAIVHGPVTAEVYGATAHIDFVKSSAVFTGKVIVTRRQGTLTADKVTILYKTRQLIAEGTTHAHFTDLESANP
jgi:lipopolysaccharide assembly outer membrane protein LptD (OstA)